MPSPAIATRCALRLQPLDDRGLLIGQHLGLDVVDAERRARRPRAVVRLSPVSITICDALGVQRAIASARRRLDRIGDADEPAALAVDGDEHHRLPLAAQRLGARRERPGIDAERPRGARRCRARRGRPSTRAGDALPGDRLEIRRRRRARRPRSRAPPTIAAASGCSLHVLEARGQAQQLGLVDAGRRLDA